MIREGLKLGDERFVLPKKAPITIHDLKLLQLNPDDFDRMVDEWKLTPEYAAEQAQRQEEALRAAMEAAASDTMYIPVI